MKAPVLYFDIGSPYAYLAVERAEVVLGTRVELQPVLLGAIFKLRGWGSWACTDRRAAGMAEVEERARRYGLPAVVWPEKLAGELAGRRPGRDLGGGVRSGGRLHPRPVPQGICPRRRYRGG